MTDAAALGPAPVQLSTCCFFLVLVGKMTSHLGQLSMRFYKCKTIKNTPRLLENHSKNYPFRSNCSRQLPGYGLHPDIRFDPVLREHVLIVRVGLTKVAFTANVVVPIGDGSGFQNKNNKNRILKLTGM